MRNRSVAFTPRATVLRVACAVVSASLLMLAPRVTHAQLGKLRKMGAEAIKDKAKDKLGVEKQDDAKSAAGSGSAGKGAAMPSLDDANIALVLASLQPQLKSAQIRDEAARVAPDWKQKVAARDACLAAAQRNPNPAKLMAAAQKNEARITALQKQQEGAQTRLNKAMEANDMDRAAFLQDTVTVTTVRMAALSLDAPCVIDFTPPALIRADLDKRHNDDRGDGFDPGAPVTNGMSRYQYGLLRERLALWGILQENPSASVGKEGVFTPEEQASLAKHAAEIKPLIALFKSDALIWKGWSDLKSW